MRKIGVFGGTLDPIHIGHTHLIVEAKRHFDLDEVIIVPAFQSPHKADRPIHESDRLKMIERATKDLDFISIDMFELEHKGKSYTYDTMCYLKEKFPNDTLYFIMGEDQFHAFDRWYKHEELLEIAQFIVLKRTMEETNITAPFLTATVPIIEVSSSEIRKRIGNDDYYSHLVHKNVFDYIKEHELYE
ncbi:MULTISPECIES: nicotinate (nicotinamide) nucleotide adenylyltransferase [Nosocomiicoccus]|uniref:Probable nicotinate-nucleotide adenylyltransferase n=1 Tax=Nosocomiicoccus massiliensis TaxID=1232430 RepID=A0AAF0YIC6_9STAP|nr:MULTISPECIES: nicotinate (nicotinamide) nucleotide adenylyltransferase [Nosocomiicoccus]OFL48929.1 nicotinate-nicotinamide nucleotide adenylyltransferase [Nosocomiicoccus sp. HMSC067E10]OFO51390.1 nicotinate-nicotinamide nucleotide adenylyltransferase [Nosocomiicoccus sp. HMSC059G07]WOS96418.1 nicotinate (nicotinamide) nucleotide adenylyltransferase [Nosocomiicoccus massiliensis]